MNKSLKKMFYQRAQSLELRDLRTLSPGVGLGRAILVRGQRPDRGPASAFGSVAVKETPDQTPVSFAAAPPTTSGANSHKARARSSVFFKWFLSFLVDGLATILLGALAWSCFLVSRAVMGNDYRNVRSLASQWLFSASWLELAAGFLMGYGFYSLIFIFLIGAPFSKILSR